MTTGRRRCQQQGCGGSKWGLSTDGRDDIGGEGKLSGGCPQAAASVLGGGGGSRDHLQLLSMLSAAASGDHPGLLVAALVVVGQPPPAVAAGSFGCGKSQVGHMPPVTRYVSPMIEAYC